ncbi:MAG: 30S ribosomal protein S16 [Chloroflexota bacterium]
MAVRIRLTRVGATKRPSYRVVAIDSRRPRDGRALEILGFYDPLTDPATVNIDADRLKAWISKGASPSETVVKLMRQAGIGGTPAVAAPATAPKKRAAASSTTKAKAKAKPKKTDVAEAAPAAETAPDETVDTAAAETPEASEPAETADAPETAEPAETKASE